MNLLVTNIKALCICQIEVVESTDQLGKRNSLIGATVFEGYDKMS